MIKQNSSRGDAFDQIDFFCKGLHKRLTIQIGRLFKVLKHAEILLKKNDIPTSTAIAAFVLNRRAVGKHL